jgi:hypothetical protein
MKGGAPIFEGKRKISLEPALRAAAKRNPMPEWDSKRRVWVVKASGRIWLRKVRGDALRIRTARTFLSAARILGVPEAIRVPLSREILSQGGSVRGRIEEAVEQWQPGLTGPRKKGLV